MEQAEPSVEPATGLITLLVAGWRQRTFLLSITAVILAATVVYSFLVPTVYTAQVTILPKNNSTSSSLLRNLASIAGPAVNTEGTYEMLYGQILKSDRILDRAIARDWDYTDFPKPVSLFRVFRVEEAGGSMPPIAVESLKKVLNNEVIEFRKDKGTGYMVLKVNAPRDGAFAADLANFLVDQLDQFNRETQGRAATDQYLFVSVRLSEVEAKLQVSEDELARFQKKNRTYTSSPDLMRRFGEINREIQAQTAIWVELRRQVELAAIEMNKDKSSVDVLDRAKPPVRKSKPQRPLYWAAGVFIGFAVAVVLLFLRHQVATFRRMASR